jgi:hypothetical protein
MNTRKYLKSFPYFLSIGGGVRLFLFLKTTIATWLNKPKANLLTSQVVSENVCWNERKSKHKL